MSTANSEAKIATKKIYDQNLKEQHADKADAAERTWLKGFKTSREQDIMAASKK
jgi:hypothetical protein